MSKRYSRERSPLSPIRYERTAGHSRSAKSPIGVSKPYSSNSYKELNSYRGKSYDKYADKKYAKHGNGYKDLADSKYGDSHWLPKENYKMESSRKCDYYKDSYKKDIKTVKRKYDKDDYRKPLIRESRHKYEKDYYKEDYKPLDKERFSKKSDYTYKEYPSVGPFKSDTRYKTEDYYKTVSPTSYKDSHKKARYSSPDSFRHSSNKDIYLKSTDRPRCSDRSPYKDVRLYRDKQYDNMLPPGCYDKFDYKDKYYDDLRYSSGGKDFKKSYKDLGDRRVSSEYRKNVDFKEYSSVLLSDDYSLRNNNSYERYVIGDSVVYGSPGHHPEVLYSPSNQTSKQDGVSSYVMNRNTRNSRYSLTPPRYKRTDTFKKNIRMSPLRSKRPLSPLRSNKTRTSFSNKQLLSDRRSKASFSRDYRQRTESLRSTPTPLKSARTNSYDNSFGSSHSKGHGPSPPKPLLSIKLSASSIPRASRMHIDHTVSIRDQVNPRERRGLGRRLDGRLGHADSARTIDRPKNDLRLWIESRKNVNKRAAKIFPTKSVQTRRENLSAIASRVRLLEARRRALQNEAITSRRTVAKKTTNLVLNRSTRNIRAARSPNKVRETRKRSRSPIRKTKKSLTERRHTLMSSRATKSTPSKRTSTRTKLLKSTTKRETSRRSRRSPVRTKRHSSISKKDKEKR